MATGQKQQGQGLMQRVLVLSIRSQLSVQAYLCLSYTEDFKQPSLAPPGLFLLYAPASPYGLKVAGRKDLMEDSQFGSPSPEPKPLSPARGFCPVVPPVLDF